MGMTTVVKKTDSVQRGRIQALGDQTKWWSEGERTNNLEIPDLITFMLQACKWPVRNPIKNKNKNLLFLLLQKYQITNIIPIYTPEIF